jgi:hypothetical protein
MDMHFRKKERRAARWVARRFHLPKLYFKPGFVLKIEASIEASIFILSKVIYKKHMMGYLLSKFSANFICKKNDLRRKTP